MAGELDDHIMQKFRRCSAIASGLKHEVEALHLAGAYAAEGLAEMLCEEMDDLFGLLYKEEAA